MSHFTACMLVLSCTVGHFRTQHLVSLFVAVINPYSFFNFIFLLLISLLLCSRIPLVWVLLVQGHYPDNKTWSQKVLNGISWRKIEKSVGTLETKLKIKAKIEKDKSQRLVQKHFKSESTIGDIATYVWKDSKKIKKYVPSCVNLKQFVNWHYLI